MIYPNDDSRQSSQGFVAWEVCRPRCTFPLFYCTYIYRCVEPHSLILQFTIVVNTDRHGGNCKRYTNIRLDQYLLHSPSISFSPFYSLPFNSNKPVLWEQFIIYVTLSLGDLICVTWYHNPIILWIHWKWAQTNILSDTCWRLVIPVKLLHAMLRWSPSKICISYQLRKFWIYSLAQ
jgi:hypothetical protein